MRNEELNGRELTAIILHDPIMTVKVLRYLESHRDKRQITDITTDRAVTMIGAAPFFSRFSEQTLIEEGLTTHTQAAEGMM